MNDNMTVHKCNTEERARGNERVRGKLHCICKIYVKKPLCILQLQNRLHSVIVVVAVAALLLRVLPLLSLLRLLPLLLLLYLLEMRERESEWNALAMKRQC